MPLIDLPMFNHLLRLLPWLAICCCAVGGCGLSPPKIAEPWEPDLPPGFMGERQTQPISATSRIEYEIQKRIFCDLKYAVRAASTVDEYSGPTDDSVRLIKHGLLPKNYAAQVSISLEVDENISLAPGVTFTNPLANLVTNAGSAHPVVNSQSNAFGLGGTLSSTATRIDKFDPYWTIEELQKPISDKPYCKIDPETHYYTGDSFDKKGVVRSSTSPFLIESVDLGIRDWLVGSMTNWYVFHRQGKNPKDAAKAPGPDAMTIDLKFVIISSGTLTPTWKLARISANNNGAFFGTGRSRTHELIVTIGPQDTNTSNSHLASQISSGVANQTRAAFAPQN